MPDLPTARSDAPSGMPALVPAAVGAAVGAGAGRVGRARAWLAVAAALAWLQAPQARAAPGEDIVVQAAKLPKARLQQQVARFVDRVIMTNEAGQAARRASRFCPAVLGLEDRYVGVVLEQVRQAAAATGRLTEAAPGCAVNLRIVFTTAGDAVAEALLKRQPRLAQGFNPAQRRAWLGSGRAVRWWYGVETRTTDGMPAIEGAVRSYNSSLISTQIKLDLSSTLVIVDVGKAEGFPLDAVASYVAMVSFAQIDVDGGLPTAPSVLGMFARAEPRGSAQRALTEWDRAYLRALYAIRLDRPLWQQRRALVAGMVEALRAPPTTPQP